MVVPELRDVVAGRTIGPEDQGYDEARTPFYGGIDRRPAAVVRVADADDGGNAVLLGEDGQVGQRRSGLGHQAGQAREPPGQGRVQRLHHEDVTR